METVNCLIIGGGPAGYTAAIYASRADLSPVVYEGIQPGGQLTTTTDIENYPGFENGISGQQLMDTMKAQAVRLGADIRIGAVTEADLSERPFKVVIDGSHEVYAQSLIIATGATAKYLEYLLHSITVVLEILKSSCELLLLCDSNLICSLRKNNY